MVPPPFYQILGLLWSSPPLHEQDSSTPLVFLEPCQPRPVFLLKKNPPCWNTDAPPPSPSTLVAHTSLALNAPPPEPDLPHTPSSTLLKLLPSPTRYLSSCHQLATSLCLPDFALRGLHSSSHPHHFAMEKGSPLLRTELPVHRRSPREKRLRALPTSCRAFPNCQLTSASPLQSIKPPPAAPLNCSFPGRRQQF